jgi:hypothetical protein
MALVAGDEVFAAGSVGALEKDVVVRVACDF